MCIGWSDKNYLPVLYWSLGNNIIMNWLVLQYIVLALYWFVGQHHYNTMIWYIGDNIMVLCGHWYWKYQHAHTIRVRTTATIHCICASNGHNTSQKQQYIASVTSTIQYSGVYCIGRFNNDTQCTTCKPPDFNLHYNTMIFSFLANAVGKVRFSGAPSYIILTAGGYCIAHGGCCMFGNPGSKSDVVGWMTSEDVWLSCLSSIAEK